MSLSNIKAEAELYLSSLQDQVLPLQQAYLIAEGNYWQGIGTPDPTPADGAIGIPDPNVARGGMPSWFSFGATLPFSAPFAVACDELRRPDGYRAFRVSAYFLWDEGSWTSELLYDGTWSALIWHRVPQPGP